MATMIEKKNTELTLNVHVTGDNQQAVATCLLHTGSGLERVQTVVGIGMHQTVLKSMIQMIEEQIRAKDVEIKLVTSSRYLYKLLVEGEYKRYTPVERLAKYGAEEVGLWNRLIAALKANNNKLLATGELDTEELERAKYTALWKLNALEEAQEAERIASSEDAIAEA